MKKLLKIIGLTAILISLVNVSFSEETTTCDHAVLLLFSATNTRIGWAESERCSPEAREFLREEAISSLPILFDIYLLHDKFVHRKTVAMQNSLYVVTKRLLSRFTTDEIRRGFEFYLDVEQRKITKYKWSVENYDFKKFDRDFISFLEMKD